MRAGVKEHCLACGIGGLTGLIWLVVLPMAVQASHTRQIDHGQRGHPRLPTSHVTLYRYQGGMWRRTTTVRVGDRIRFDLAITQPGFYSPRATILIQRQGRPFALPPRPVLYFYQHAMRRLDTSPEFRSRFTLSLMVHGKEWSGHDVARFAITNGRIIDGVSLRFSVGSAARGYGFVVPMRGT
jgi:hypothetical protein